MGQVVLDGVLVGAGVGHGQLVMQAALPGQRGAESRPVSGVVDVDPGRGRAGCAGWPHPGGDRIQELEGKLSALQARNLPTEWANDATLKERVESELFRDPEVPKGAININAEQGIVVLRGEVSDETMRESLAARAGEIEGVWYVENLLHLPGEPAPTVR